MTDFLKINKDTLQRLQDRAERDKHSIDELLAGLLDDAEYQHEQALLYKSEIRYRELVDYAPGAILLVDETGRIVLVNQYTESLFGYERDELIRMAVEQLLPENYKHSHKTHRNHFFAHPESRLMGAGRDLTARHKTGSEFSIEVGLSYYKASQLLEQYGYKQVAEVIEHAKNSRCTNPSGYIIRALKEKWTFYSVHEKEDYASGNGLAYITGKYAVFIQH